MPVELDSGKKPKDILVGIGRGSRSFFTHTRGIRNTVSSFSHAVSSGSEGAVGDDDYFQECHLIRGYILETGRRG